MVRAAIEQHRRSNFRQPLADPGGLDQVIPLGRRLAQVTDARIISRIAMQLRLHTRSGYCSKMAAGASFNATFREFSYQPVAHAPPGPPPPSPAPAARSAPQPAGSWRPRARTRARPAAPRAAASAGARTAAATREVTLRAAQSRSWRPANHAPFKRLRVLFNERAVRTRAVFVCSSDAFLESVFPTRVRFRTMFLFLRRTVMQLALF